MGFNNDKDPYFICPRYGFYVDDIEDISGENIMNYSRGIKGKKASNVVNKEVISRDLLSASAQDVNRILKEIDNIYLQVYTELDKYKVNRAAARYILSLAIGYGLDNKNRYSGDNRKRSEELARDFYNVYNQVLLVTMISGVPTNTLRNILNKVMYITIRNSSTSGGQPPSYDRW